MGVVFPETILVTAVSGSVLGSLEVDGHGRGRGENLQRTLDRVMNAAGEIGYPVFLKSDLSSQKHRGIEHIKAENPGDVERLVPEIFEDNVCKDLFPEGIMVREWLTIVADFKAFGGLPIGSEWRVFATKDEVLCQHPYWPKDAIKFWKCPGEKEPAGWRSSLRRAQAVRLPEWALEAAMGMAEACPAAKAWSVDFALGWGSGGSARVYMIDMADAKHSEHLRAWPNCRVPLERQEAMDDRKTGLNP